MSKLTKALEGLSGGSTNKGNDNRFWQAEVDKAGNGYAVIRFLDSPQIDGEDGMPWVQIFNHGFQGPGGWLIENCLTTINGKCPVCEHNSALWNSGIESNKDVVRKQKRKLSYIANILVIKDAAHPENEGKVFLYKFGKKIFDKIKEKIEPQFEDEKAVNPFNFWEGANFKLKIRNVEGYRNYDKSEFDSVSALADGDDADIEKIWKAAHSLKAFLAASEFKTHEELKAKLDRTLGLSGSVKPRFKSAEEAGEEVSEPVQTSDSGTTTEDDDTLSYFNRLAAE
ncbi:single-stranded DNA binding protein [uncultured Caudovirales phage]|uniref:Single-stranded DNA-binding protein n=1 Tax=uncultured Caudovirales phage TaxID=2100421 RepID=A0A6J5KNZ5_9CAUD|nr:single-stranded DNA binding protein [uncultured Caudovirales phage]